MGVGPLQSRRRYFFLIEPAMAVIDQTSGSLPFNFLGLPPECCDYDNSRVVIVPVGYESTTSYLGGTREGPLAIIKASRFMEYYDPQLKQDFTTLGIVTLPPLAIDVSGPEAMLNRLQRLAEKLLDDNKFIVMLGGEHSLTIAIVRALHQRFDQMGVLQIDAHLDLRDSYEGSPYSHACAMRRIIDLCPLVQVGIRSVAEEEQLFLNARGLSPYFAWDLPNNPGWPEQVANKLPPQVYITIDMDGLDPSIMPAVGTPEPGGLLWEELQHLLTRIAERHRIIGCDLVELCPIPGMIAPDYLASKLAYRLIALAHSS